MNGIQEDPIPANNAKSNRKKDKKKKKNTGAGGGPKGENEEQL
jgi:hypothetical protein